MDSITHGIAGALVGKAFYAGSGPAADECEAEKRRVAVFAATFGAVFPDADIIVALLDRTHGAALEIHRGITHSLVCLPAFAIVLALGTRWYTRRRHIAAPSLFALVGIYASVLLLHIFMDLVTSWGTMIWSPLSKARATWDWTMIVDLTVTTILLLPQVAARAYRSRDSGFVLRLSAWITLSLFAFVEYGFSFGVLGVAMLLLGVVLLGPAYRGWGFQVRRETWCRAGFAGFVLYMCMQGVAHEVALGKVQRFAAAHGLQVGTIGALPSVPSLVAWTGLIRTNDGVYYSRFDLPGTEPQFDFVADSPANTYIDAAKQAPAAKQFLWFTRFPQISYAHEGRVHRVEFADFRFPNRGGQRRHFVVSVTLDDNGKILDQTWPEH